MKLPLMTWIVLPAVLAGPAAAQAISICPGPVANVPRIYMPGPRIAPYMPMPEIMPGGPIAPAPHIAPLVPKILPIMPEPARVTPIVPMPRIAPIMPVALSVPIAAAAKDAPAEEAVKELERLFDGRTAPAVKVPVKQPAGEPVVRPSRRVGLPEQDLEREIGVP